MFSTRAAPSLKTNHYLPQPRASVNNVIYSTRFVAELCPYLCYSGQSFMIYYAM